MVRDIPLGKAMVLSIASLLLSVADSDGANYFPLREGNYWIYGSWSPSRVNERTGDIVHMILAGSSITLRDRGPEYHDAWLGDADRDIMPVGVHVDDPAQRFWFSYVRLRDASVLWHDNFPLPEVCTGLDPSAR